jgi:hypothetical protein
LRELDFEVCAAATADVVDELGTCPNVVGKVAVGEENVVTAVGKEKELELYENQVRRPIKL